MFEGIMIILYDKVKVGEDEFNHPVYEEVPKEVKNVLVSPSSSTDIVDNLSLYGKKAIFTLAIPKGDTNIWEDRTVEFFGKKWRTFGFVTEGIEQLIPLDWNKKVMVERYE
ncbi:MAG: hypothetical protein E7299_04830 [Lachnospiraceae bacterium]|nr:hypothetical protein [Lachnospiraceae bacterium]